MNINSAAVSKINWTNLIAAAAGLTAVFGLDISDDLQTKIVTGIALAMPVVNIVLRTFFTGK